MRGQIQPGRLGCICGLWLGPVRRPRYVSFAWSCSRLAYVPRSLAVAGSRRSVAEPLIPFVRRGRPQAHANTDKPTSRTWRRAAGRGPACRSVWIPPSHSWNAGAAGDPYHDLRRERTAQAHCAVVLTIRAPALGRGPRFAPSAISRRRTAAAGGTCPPPGSCQVGHPLAVLADLETQLRPCGAGCGSAARHLRARKVLAERCTGSPGHRAGAVPAGWRGGRPVLLLPQGGPGRRADINRLLSDPGGSPGAGPGKGRRWLCAGRCIRRPARPTTPAPRPRPRLLAQVKEP